MVNALLYAFSCDKEEDNMENNNNLNENELKKVGGGSSDYIPRQLFFVGDKVLVRIYPEYGVGTVRAVDGVPGSWECVVQFVDGMMTADQSEFIPAT